MKGALSEKWIISTKGGDYAEVVFTEMIQIIEELQRKASDNLYPYEMSMGPESWAQELTFFYAGWNEVILTIQNTDEKNGRLNLFLLVS